MKKIKIQEEVDKFLLNDVVIPTLPHHDCKKVGDIELSDDWRFCPYCGQGITRLILAWQKLKEITSVARAWQ